MNAGTAFIQLAAVKQKGASERFVSAQRVLGPIALADLMDRRAPRRAVGFGIALALASTMLVAAAIHFGNVRGAVVVPFVPMCATLWCVADLLTAYLLLTQFSVNGMRAFAIFGLAYGISGLLTIPYIAFFPGVFGDVPAVSARLQVSVWLWVVWHFTFPALVAGSRVFDRAGRVRIPSKIGVERWLAGAIAGSVVGCLLLVAVVIIAGDRGRLPIIVAGGTFTPLFQSTIAPALVALNIIAAVVVLSSRRTSTLELWLSVTLLIAGLDAWLNAASAGRYYLGWYVGKLETVAASAIVLMVLLGEINALYGRLGRLATIDALTGLSNRQAFDNDARFALRLQERDPTDVAFLVVDIDFFKQYNDTYGHQTGDACIVRIAHCIRNSCGRSIDLVGRFGGEEFVILLQGTNASGAIRIGETIRESVEKLGIPHTGSTVAPVVTVSVGATQAHSERDIRLETLFKRADDALYRAKVTRNSVFMEEATDAVGQLVHRTA